MPAHRNSTAGAGHTVVLKRRGESVALSYHAPHERRGSFAVPGTSHVPQRTPPLARYGPQAYEMPATTNLAIRFGIQSFFGRLSVRVLIWVLVFQPVYVALGMELDAPAEEVPVVVEEDTATGDEPSSDDEVVGGESGTDEEESIPTSDTTDQEGADSATGETSDTTSSVDEDADPATGDANTNDAEEDLTESAEEHQTDDADDTASTDGAGGEHQATDVDDDAETGTGYGEASTSTDADGIVSGAYDADETATGTDETATTSDETAVEDETMMGTSSLPHTFGDSFVFNTGDCTLVAEGEFYCVKQDAPRIATGDPRVYAERDREGDREIYYFDGVEIHRITNNSYDDFAPVFEDEEQRIVWQSMLNDRLQIMLHDLTTDATWQLTQTRENSSNPHIGGDIVVWQEWVATNWEIMMADVDTRTGEFDIQQLTDNGVHDMFPQVFDGLITWQREKGTSWEVVVRDVRTGKEHVLEKTENTKYENPRFVLLFDSKQENGDVETVGYNLDTGEMMELGTRANPQPQAPASPKDEVPDALPREATSTPQVKVKSDGLDDGDGSDDIL